jgi:hypothetical protein
LSEPPAQGKPQFAIARIQSLCHCTQLGLPRFGLAVESAYASERDIAHVEALIGIVDRDSHLAEDECVQERGRKILVIEALLDRRAAIS